MKDHSNGYYDKVVELITKIEEEQYENIRAAGRLMAQAIQEDRLIHVYGGGGHTTLPVGEMFFRAGGLCNINPCMETGLSVFNQAQKYLALERCENYGRAIMDYYDLQEGDVLIRESMPYDHNGRHATGRAEYIGGKWWNIYE